MRRRSVVTALVVLTAGLTASAALRRLARHRSAAVGRAPVGRPATPVAPAVVAPAVAPAAEREAVVLPFARRAAVVPAPAQPTAPARCGDTGGRTRAGAPCAARAGEGGRCHHHRVAA